MPPYRCVRHSTSFFMNKTLTWEPDTVVFFFVCTVCIYHGGYVPGIVSLQVIRDGAPRLVLIVPFPRVPVLLRCTYIRLFCFRPSRRFFAACFLWPRRARFQEKWAMNNVNTSVSHLLCRSARQLTSREKMLTYVLEYKARHTKTNTARSVPKEKDCFHWIWIC